jgi:hypothetical protein
LLQALPYLVLPACLLEDGHLRTIQGGGQVHPPEAQNSMTHDPRLT